jgi:hypothetical protein
VILSLLDPRVWMLVAAVGAAGYLKGCHDGQQGERNAQSAATGKANLESFKTTERLQRNADEASTLAAARAADDRARAAGADRAISGLRDTLDATQLHAAQSLAAATATVAAYRAVFESYTAEYRALGQEAAGHASDSLKYQQGWPE